MFTGEEEANGPWAGVVGGATLWVIVHLIGGIGVDRAGCSEGNLQQLLQATLSFSPPVWDDYVALCVEHFSSVTFLSALSNTTAGEELGLPVFHYCLRNREKEQRSHAHKTRSSKDRILT